MTTVEAMKRLICFILNDGTTPDQIPDTNATLLWIRLGDAFNARFNGASSSLGELILMSTPGTLRGTTVITVTGAGAGALFKYAAASDLPAVGQDLSAWTDWDGVTAITVPDGTAICIAEVDSTAKAVRAGTVITNSKW